jgi:hypothetical protein
MNSYYHVSNLKYRERLQSYIDNHNINCKTKNCVFSSKRYEILAENIYLLFIKVIKNVYGASLMDEDARSSIFVICTLCEFNREKISIATGTLFSRLGLNSQNSMARNYAILIDIFPKINNILGITSISKSNCLSTSNSIKCYIIDSKRIIKVFPFVLTYKDALERDCMFYIMNVVILLYKLDYFNYCWFKNCTHAVM